MGITDLRRFVGVLRDGAPESTEPVTMLRLHRNRLVEDIEHIQAALCVIDDKIAHYAGRLGDLEPDLIPQPHGT